MTYEEMKSKACVASSRSKPKNEEHKIQCSCVRYLPFKISPSQKYAVCCS